MQDAIADGGGLEAAKLRRGTSLSSADEKVDATTRPSSGHTMSSSSFSRYLGERRMTTSIRRVILVSLFIATSASLLGAQTRSHYRTYQMGDHVLAISRQIGVPSPPVTLVPRTLGAVEELRWRAQHVRRGVAPSSDPVARLVFSFYEDQLFRIVIDYGSDRTEGMTEADMVAAVSKVYGAPAKRTDPPNPVGLRPQRPVDSVVAQWTDGDHQVALLAVQGQAAFRMIVASASLEAVARGAGAREAPADLHDWASIDAGPPNAYIERAGSARDRTRRANIASFIP